VFRSSCFSFIAPTRLRWTFSLFQVHPRFNLSLLNLNSVVNSCKEFGTAN